MDCFIDFEARKIGQSYDNQEKSESSSSDPDNIPSPTLKRPRMNRKDSGSSKDVDQMKNMMEEVLETVKKLEERIEKLKNERGSSASGRSTRKSEVPSEVRVRD